MELLVSVGRPPLRLQGGGSTSLFARGRAAPIVVCPGWLGNFGEGVAGARGVGAGTRRAGTRRAGKRRAGPVQIDSLISVRSSLISVRFE